MKKIDLHVHTKSSLSDWYFEFSLTVLKDYVKSLDIDGIAITNHNQFDKDQFEEIKKELNIVVLPGIEIDIEKGHLLLISDDEELDDFTAKCDQVSHLITTNRDYINKAQLVEIFGDLSRYLLIPHYEKNPPIPQSLIDDLNEEFGNLISGGEVSSVKKFLTTYKDKDKLTPVLFSDTRMVEGLDYSTRQTWVDIDEINITAIKSCLFNRSRVSLSREEGNDIFQVLPNGLHLSTGLNVIFGGRSSGKSVTLEAIKKHNQNVKLIEQFALVQKDEAKFNEKIKIYRSTVVEDYLLEFRQVVDEVKSIDLAVNHTSLHDYLAKLKRFATETEKRDAYSKAKLFSESLLRERSLAELKELILSVQKLIDSVAYRDIIDSLVNRQALIELLRVLIDRYRGMALEKDQIKITNDLIQSIQSSLQSRSSATGPGDIDLLRILEEEKKIESFQKIVKLVQQEREIYTQEIRGFKIVASTRCFTGAGQLKDISGTKLAFKAAFEKYSYPYKFLRLLNEIGIEDTSYYKYFVDINFGVKNKYGLEVSGGEMAEFNLLHEINDALKYDMLLIDEPESSFDNLFLKDHVNENLKMISKEIPVVIVTHNNTVGATIEPDYVVFTQRVIADNKVEDFKLFTGRPSDKMLKGLNGEEISNYEATMDCLEAGDVAYANRREKSYDILKNR